MLLLGTSGAAWLKPGTVSGPGQSSCWNRGPQGGQHKSVLKDMEVGEVLLYFKAKEVSLPDFPAGIILGGQISS